MSYPSSLQRLIDGFELLPEWEDRYRAIIDLGKKLAPLTDEEHADENRVRGCVSQVWLIEDEPEQDPLRVRFRADSDSFIVKGLIGILLAMYDGRTPAEIMDTDSKAAFGLLGLDRHLSPLRSNGLFSIDREMRKRAAARG